MKKILAFSLLCLIALTINAQEYVDLGLPSGTMWKDVNEEGGFYTYEQAVSKFGNNLPTQKQLEELTKSCKWTWTDNGYEVVGPSGKSIFLPAEGSRFCCGMVYNVGPYGEYWTSSIYYDDLACLLHFDSEKYSDYGTKQCTGLSVRLVKK